MKLAAVLLTGISLCHLGHASAEPARWSPGERVTSRMRGEVQPSDEITSADGVYGRFDGDLTLTFGLGAELGGGTRGAALGRLLYYHSAGLVFGYSDRLGQDDELERVGFLGAELRPLFLPRWALDLEFDSALLDLTLDSLSLGICAFVSEPGTAKRSIQSGFELSAGLGVPLFAKAEGLWLEARGAFRPQLDRADTSVLLALSFYETWVSPLVQ
jgi:hypothetical protein